MVSFQAGSSSLPASASSSRPPAVRKSELGICQQGAELSDLGFEHGVLGLERLHLAGECPLARARCLGRSRSGEHRCRQYSDHNQRFHVLFVLPEAGAHSDAVWPECPDTFGSFRRRLVLPPRRAGRKALLRASGSNPAGIWAPGWVTRPAPAAPSACPRWWDRLTQVLEFPGDLPGGPRADLVRRSERAARAEARGAPGVPVGGGGSALRARSRHGLKVGCPWARGTGNSATTPRSTQACPLTPERPAVSHLSERRSPDRTSPSSPGGRRLRARPRGRLLAWRSGLRVPTPTSNAPRARETHDRPWRNCDGDAGRSARAADRRTELGRWRESAVARLASVVQLQEFQEFADLVAVLGGVTHGYVGSDAVAVSTADPFALDVAGFD